MKFISAFSTGKDSVLALHRMIAKGHEPIGLLVMYNINAKRSWFHGTEEALLESIADSLGLKVYYGKSDGYDYSEIFESCLKQAAKDGAEACVFGDIDIEDHKEWDEERCKNAGLSAVLPLWNESREALVRETVDTGYKCIIKCLHTEQLPESFLGKVLSEEVLKEMSEYDIDLCGENGEYHTVVVDGPIFKNKVDYQIGKVLQLEHVSAIEIYAGRKI